MRSNSKITASLNKKIAENERKMRDILIINEFNSIPIAYYNKNKPMNKSNRKHHKIKPIQRTFKKKIKYQKDIKQEVKTDIIKPINKLQFNNLDSYITKEVKDSTLDKDKIINLQRKIRNFLKEKQEPKAKPINSKYYFTKSTPIKQEIIQKISLDHRKNGKN